jgi:tryptophan synthase beta chain
MDGTNSLRNGPDEHGRFGIYGGRFVAETLMPLILDLEKEYRAAKVDPTYAAELKDLATHYTAQARSILPSV